MHFSKYTVDRKKWAVQTERSVESEFHFFLAIDNCLEYGIITVDSGKLGHNGTRTLCPN